MTLTCTDSNNKYPDVNLREVDYDIDEFPAGILYVADFNKMKCLSPSGNHAHLYYHEDDDDINNSIKLCRVLTINGWIDYPVEEEDFAAAIPTTKIVIGQGEDNDAYGKTNLNYFV